MRILTVVGTRPQFVKVAALSRAIREHNETNPEQLTEILVHTGQHYDYGLSGAFFDEFRLPEPDRHLGVGSGPPGRQVGQMMMSMVSALPELDPDIVLVVGDTNSTLAAALVAAQMNIPLAHVEAGVRSYNRRMPEEVNRVVADRISSLLLCSSQNAVGNLEREGIVDGVIVTGDVMLDILRAVVGGDLGSTEMARNIGVKAFALATVHRAENTDDGQRLKGIFEGLKAVAESGLPVVLPLHPRTRHALEVHGIETGSINILEPVGYREMLSLQRDARVVLTDSGGIQKEALWLGTPCVTLRDETEWVETIESGWNRLVGADALAICGAALSSPADGSPPILYGDGNAARSVVEALVMRGPSL